MGVGLYWTRCRRPHDALCFTTCRDEALTRLLSTYAPEPNVVRWTNEPTPFTDLSTSTVRRNKDLENRVAELEVELLVWKQAHSVAIEASEREVKAHNVQIAALNRQISNMDSFKSVSCQAPFLIIPKLNHVAEPPCPHIMYRQW